MKECVYCAVNNDGQIEWVLGSSNQTRYFRTTKYLKKAVAYHNKIRPDDPWHIVQFDLTPTQVIGIEEDDAND